MKIWNMETFYWILIESHRFTSLHNFSGLQKIFPLYRVGFIFKPIKEYKLVNLIIAVDQNNQGMIWIHKKYGNMKYMKSQLLLWKYEIWNRFIKFK